MTVKYDYLIAIVGVILIGRLNRCQAEEILPKSAGTRIEMRQTAPRGAVGVPSSCQEVPGGKGDVIQTVGGRSIPISELDAFLKQQMDSLGLPGLSIAILNGDRIVYHRMFGVTNIETKAEVSEQTLFDAGSLTKAAFAFLVMKLVEQGVLDLDIPLYTYLPYPDIAYDERYKQITARMVLSHTSGFPNWRFFNKDGKLDLKFAPGTQVLYSGEGYEYLADVLAHQMKIKKNELQDVFKKLVAKPVGMKNTYFVWNTFVAKHQANGHVAGKVSEGYGISPKKPDFYASYSMQTNAIDYARLLLALMHDRVLKKASFAEMYKVSFPEATKAANAPNNDAWGFGIAMRPTEFGTEYHNDGYNLNFTSAFLFNKEHEFGYVFFTNCNKGDDFNKNLEKLLYR